MSAVSALKNLFGSDPKAAPARGKKSTALSEKIDRLGQLKAMLEPVKTLQDEYEKLRKELIAALTPQGHPDGELSVKGKAYTLVLSARSSDRSVPDLQTLHMILGHSAFLEVVRPSLTEIDKRLSADDQAQVITITPGNRKIKALVPTQAGIH